jgi:hypothetical protein
VIEQVDTSGLRAMCEGLAERSGASYEKALISEVGKILKICMQRTPTRTAAAITKRVSRSNNYIEFGSGQIVSFWKKADAVMFLDDSTWNQTRTIGKRAPRMKNGKSWHQMDGGANPRRWSMQRWARWKTFEALAKEKKRDPKKAVKARGLAKQTWHVIAQDLGIDIGAPKYVRDAQSPTGKTFREGQARKLIEAAAFYIEVTNSNPIMGKLNGRAIMERAMAQRLRAFEFELQKGVFDDVAMRAKRYPGIFTQ